MTVHVLALQLDLRFTDCASLKDKRARLRPVIDGVRHRFGVSIAETDHHDVWQRSEVAVAVVAGSAHRAEQVLDEVERFVWARPDLEVGGSSRHWMELDR